MPDQEKKCEPGQCYLRDRGIDTETVKVLLVARSRGENLTPSQLDKLIKFHTELPNACIKCPLRKLVPRQKST